MYVTFLLKNYCLVIKNSVQSMKVIIAGSRRFPTVGINKPEHWRSEALKVMYDLLLETISSSKFEITEVVSGECWGIDKLGEKYASEKGLSVKKFPADWSTGRGAGFLRNQEMVTYADASISVMSDGSKGSLDLIARMKKANKPFFAVVIG